jgi:hypothetical protein
LYSTESTPHDRQTDAVFRTNGGAGVVRIRDVTWFRIELRLLVASCGRLGRSSIATRLSFSSYSGANQATEVSSETFRLLLLWSGVFSKLTTISWRLAKVATTSSKLCFNRVVTILDSHLVVLELLSNVDLVFFLLLLVQIGIAILVVSQEHIDIYKIVSLGNVLTFIVVLLCANVVVFNELLLLTNHVFQINNSSCLQLQIEQKLHVLRLQEIVLDYQLNVVFVILVNDFIA